MPDLNATGDEEADGVYAALLSAIFSRDLPPQTKLSEETIASSFSTNRIVVRAALNRLSADALVVFEKNRGAFVASPSDKEADEVFALWAMLEAQAVRMLTPVMTNEQIAILQRNVDENRSHARAGDSRRDVDAAQQFHLLLISMLNNNGLETIVYRLICRSALILALHPRRQRTEYGIDEHQEIIDRLAAGDAEAAAKAASDHLHNTLARARVLDEVTNHEGLADILARHTTRAAPAKAVKRGRRQNAP